MGHSNYRAGNQGVLPITTYIPNSGTHKLACLHQYVLTCVQWHFFGDQELEDGHMLEDCGATQGSQLEIWKWWQAQETETLVEETVEDEQLTFDPVADPDEGAARSGPGHKRRFRTF